MTVLTGFRTLTVSVLLPATPNATEVAFIRRERTSQTGESPRNVYSVPATLGLGPVGADELPPPQLHHPTVANVSANVKRLIAKIRLAIVTPCHTEAAASRLKKHTPLKRLHFVSRSSALTFRW